MSSMISKSLLRAMAIALDNERPVDWQLRQFFKSHPALGRRDRGLIADTLFDVLRNRRLYAHLAQGGSGTLERRLWLLSWSWPKRKPSNDAHAQIDATERVWLERVLQIDVDSLPAAVALSVPDWVYQKMLVCGGEAATRSVLTALLRSAPLDLRVNTQKATTEQVLESLRLAGIAVHALPSVPGALRVPGKPALENTAAFEQGWFEVQDVGSQILSYVAAPKRGQIVVDFCAGAGGKSLAMGALMRDSGQLFACDVSLSRLQRLKPRLARAGLSNIQPFAIDSERDPKLKRLAAKADVVLVDAPCSGLGTLRRNPDLKWRWQPSDIDELQTKQLAILQAAAQLVKPGGVLVYATCSLLSEENEVICQRFGQAQQQWQLESPGTVLAQAGIELADATTPYVQLRPDRDDCDGFFAARWRRA